MGKCKEDDTLNIELVFGALEYYTGEHPFLFVGEGGEPLYSTIFQKLIYVSIYCRNAIAHLLQFKFKM